MDNFYRKRFGTDPVSNDMSVNVSVLALLHVTPIRPFERHRSLQNLVDEVPLLAARLTRVEAQLRSKVVQLAATQLDGAHIRVPLDIPRQGVHSSKQLFK